MKALFEQGKDFEEYLNEIEGGISKKVARLFQRIDDFNLPSSQPSITNLLILSEVWCPDCLVLMAAVQKLQAKEPALKIRMLGKEGHDDILEDRSNDGKARIPLIIFLDQNFNQQGFISERPQSITALFAEDEQAHKNYRAGAFMSILIEELIKQIWVEQ